MVLLLFKVIIFSESYELVARLHNATANPSVGDMGEPCASSGFFHESIYATWWSMDLFLL